GGRRLPARPRRLPAAAHGAGVARADLGEQPDRPDLPRARRRAARGAQRYLPRPAARALLRRARVGVQRAGLRTRVQGAIAPAQLDRRLMLLLTATTF